MLVSFKQLLSRPCSEKLFFLIFLCLSFALLGQSENASQELPPGSSENKENFKKEVQVISSADDLSIADRLKKILEATHWYSDVNIRVQEGVVFLSGVASSDESRDWAAELAKKTEAVVAVVNVMTVKQPDLWDITPALNQLKELSGIIMRKTPLIILGIFLFVGLYYLTILSIHLVRWLLFYRFRSVLLRDVLARALAVPIFLLGLFIIFYMTGLSRLAMTLIGGTGLLGLILGFAFKDIAENFLASILISIQHPFSVGDLIEVSGFEGVVQSVNTRTTVLLSQKGNYVQIPNAIIYKESIINFTANPQTRDDFYIGISYEDSISHAQTIILLALKDHEAISDDPAPLVLVNDLDSSTVKLRVSYWFDISKLNRFKVRSSVIRSVKNALDDAGISMPDDAREIIFPSGVPIQMIEIEKTKKAKDTTKTVRKEDLHEDDAEGDLTNDDQEIEEQGKKDRQPEREMNLLD